MKKFIFLLLAIILIAAPTLAETFVRQKNVATYVVFPILKNDGTLITGASGLDSEIDAFADGTAPDGFTDCTNEATEIGSTGQYYLSLTQSEMNADYIIVQIKSSSTGAVVQTILIRTLVGDPLLLATTDDGGAINVTSGKIDEVSTLTGHTAQTGDTYAIVNNGTYGNSALNTVLTSTGVKLSSGTGSGQISLSSGAVTVGTNNDKTGYTASTVSDKTGYSLTADQSAVTIGTVTTLTNAPSDSSGVTTLLGRLTAPRAGYLDNLDAAISTRLASASYTAPDNTNIGNIYSEVTNASYGLSKLVRSTTPANTLDVSATGEAGLDFNNIKDAAGAHTLTNVTVPTVTAITNDVGITQSGADKVWGTAARALTDKSGFTISGTKTTLDSLNDISAASVWSVASRTLSDYSGVWDKDISGYSAAGLAGTYLKGASAPSASSIADAVWDEAISGHLNSGSTGESLNAAGGSGDPWVTALPGSYTTGQAGYILGTYLNATVSSRSTYAGGDTSGTTTLLSRLTDTRAGYLDAAISSRSSHSATDVWSSGTRTLTAGTNISLAKGTGITGFNDITASDVASLILFTPANKLVTDASGRVTVGTNDDKTGYRLSSTGIDDIWDELQSGHTLSGSFGKYLDAQVSAVGGGSLTVEGIADAVLDELVSDHAGVGSLGETIRRIDKNTKMIR